jgi:hypothetical protein
MPQLPKALMSGDQAFPGAAIGPGREGGRSLDHELQQVQQLSRDLNVRLVACVMEGDEDLIGQTPGVAGRRGRDGIYRIAHVVEIPTS